MGEAQDFVSFAPMVPPRGTLVLSKSDIAALMTHADYLRAAEAAFLSLTSGAIVAALPMHVHGHDGTFHVKGARLDNGKPVVAIKLNGNFPNNPDRFGLPTIQGAILLADAERGSLLAIMDSMEITLRRTAAASALAARYLARPDSTTIAICGCGEQGRAQLEAMAAIFRLQEATVWDRDFERSRVFASRLQESLNMPVRPVSALSDATATADIIVTCTTSRSPFLGPAHAGKGAFIAAVGADNPEKSEIMPELMSSSRIVVDVLDQCLAMGDLHHAVTAGVLSAENVWSELGPVVAGTRNVSTAAGEIYIFDSTGTAAQDVAAAIQVYGRAVEGGIGVPVFLGS